MNELVRYDSARMALAEASSVDDAREIRDKAAALQAYARQRSDVEMEKWVAEIKLRAHVRIGELSAELEKAPPGPTPEDTSQRWELSTKAATLKAAGISTSVAHRAEQLAANPAAVEKYIAEKAKAGRPVTIDEALTVARKKEKQQAPKTHAADVGREYCTTSDLATLAGKQFATILADPPWQYGNQSTRGATGDHYVGMTVDEICALPIAGTAADNAHLHLWTTNAFLFDAQRVMESWGFTYKSCFVWVKPQIGMGNYWRVSHEFLLLGVRGSLPFADRSLRSWAEFRRGQHSAKPEQIRDLIHRASPGPRLELFARRAVEGWTVWGNEIRREVFAA